ncbi:hypothetical protein AQUCO_00700176v1 [Aquilegia coerulea]|uniref:Uncharacterized protein n=1 Tax=Aquilegia coerulea TaxID=218851 RepID=A0A2G5EIT9_AQUCA|nr:hypothetical protein AQUCO_00700176v1 [Aquilegia coerulea]
MNYDMSAVCSLLCNTSYTWFRVHTKHTRNALYKIESLNSRNLVHIVNKAHPTHNFSVNLVGLAVLASCVL